MLITRRGNNLASINIEKESMLKDIKRNKR